MVEVAGAEGSGHLVYSNTLGELGNAGFGTAFRLADDLVTTASDGCVLDRYEFEVAGSLAGGDGGPFTVTFGLYDECPGRGGQPIAGTSGVAALPDGGNYWVQFQTPPESDVPLPNTLWLNMSFDRAGAGWVGGAPPLVGYSDDSFEDSVFGCAISFGGFPRARHSSFNARVYVRDECPAQFLAYRARTPQLTTFIPGPGVGVADDLRLATETCRIASYTVAVRGIATFDIDLRLPDAAGTGPGEIIPGTDVTVATLRLASQYIGRTFDPPIAIPNELWITVRNTSVTGRVSLAGRPINVGDTDDTFAVREDDQWELLALLADGQSTALDVSIACAGDAPPGACCDLIFLDGRGEAVCREVPSANCLFRRWVPGAACTPDPFDPFCGQAACCLADGTCAHLSQNECRARGTEWYANLFCDATELECEEICVRSDLPCSFPHNTPGCVDPQCCARVCDHLSGLFCCDYFWDEACASLAAILCDSPPSNDECAPSLSAAGAHELAVPSSLEVHTNRATTVPEDPAFCCHGGLTPRCAGGDWAGARCQDDDECAGGVCATPLEATGVEGYGSTWFRFTVPPGADTASIEISTCRSSAARDSMLQLFQAAHPDGGVCLDLGRCFDGSPCTVSAEDCSDGTRCVASREPCSVTGQDCPHPAACTLDTETACHQLERIACEDDTPGCSTGSTHARLCAPALKRGETYIIELAGKSPSDLGNYIIEIREVPGCSTQSEPANAYCGRAEPIGEGETPVDLAGAKLDCPHDLCSTLMGRDVWFDYTAPSAGRATVELSGPSQTPLEWPELAIYRGCDCDFLDGSLHACGPSASRTDVPASHVAFRAAAGECFKIRVGNLPGDPPEARVNIAFDPNADCPPGAVAWIDPPTGVIDARTPAPPGLAYRYSGIDRLVVDAPAGADLLECWSVCETVDSGSPNAVWSVVPSAENQFTLFLSHALRPGVVASISYTAAESAAATGRFTVHPGNVNADTIVSGDDLLELGGVLTGNAAAPWDGYSVDFDHDGRLTPEDLLAAVEALRGGRIRAPWIGTTLPQNDGRCP
jgi:hypothetical protein